MHSHFIFYLALAIAYTEASFESFSEGKIRAGCREAIMAVIYISLAFFALDTVLVAPFVAPNLV